MLPSGPHSKKMKTEQGYIPTLLCDDTDSEAAKRKIPTSSTMELFLDSNATNLLDLPDDCLYEIFNLRRLSVVDLIALTETCVRLKEIAIETFGRSQKICNFNLLVKMDTWMDTVTGSRVLKTFGASIVELTILFRYPLDGATIIDSIIEHCTSLKSLSIGSYFVPDSQSAINKMAQLFEKLEILSMTEINIEGLEDLHYGTIMTPNGNLLNLFANCNSLINLTVTCCSNLSRSIFESYFPKLEHFKYFHSGESMDEGFVLRHRNLKSFTFMDTEKEDSLSLDCLNIVANNCKQLENLCVITYTLPLPYDTTLKSFEKLKHLTNLKIAWDGQHMTELVKNLQSTPLKLLDLQDGRGCSEMLPTISTMKALRVLKLNYIDGLLNYNSLENMPQLVELYINHHENFSIEFDIGKVINRLVNLKKFKFHADGFHIEGQLYTRLVNVVHNRPVAENRYLEIDFVCDDFHENLYCPKIVAIKDLEYEIHFVP